MTLRETFIKNLKYYRKLSGLRQLDLALEIDKSTNYINSIENGKYFPSPETIEKIADVLKIDPTELFNKMNIEKSKDDISKSSIDAIEKQLTEKILEEINNSFLQLKRQ